MQVSPPQSPSLFLDQKDDPSQCHSAGRVYHTSQRAYIDRQGIIQNHPRDLFRRKGEINYQKAWSWLSLATGICWVGHSGRRWNPWELLHQPPCWAYPEADSLGAHWCHQEQKELGRVWHILSSEDGRSLKIISLEERHFNFFLRDGGINNEMHWDLFELFWTFIDEVHWSKRKEQIVIAPFR